MGKQGVSKLCKDFYLVDHGNMKNFEYGMTRLDLLKKIQRTVKEKMGELSRFGRIISRNLKSCKEQRE